MRRHRVLAVAFAALVTALVVGRAVLTPIVRRAIERSVSERYGVEATARDLSLSLFSGSATLEGLRARDGALDVLEIERVEVHAGLFDLLAGRVDLARLDVVRPVVRVVVEPDGRTNVARILATPPRAPRASGPAGILVVRDATVTGGRVEYDDAVTDPANPLRVELRDVRASAAELQLSGSPATPSLGDFRLDGELGQPVRPARLCVVGWCPPQGDAPTFTLHAALTGVDLSRFPQYTSATQRAAIGGDLIHLVTDIVVTDGVIDPGAVVGEVANTGAVLPLRVGGTTDAPVFDLGSPLAALLAVPLGRIGRFGRVALGAGWSVLSGGERAAGDVGEGVGNAGSSIAGGASGAASDIAAGDPLGALGVAAAGVAGGAVALGKGLVAGVRSLFGGGAEAAAAADPAVLDEQFRALHAKRRLAMLRAARDSASADDPARRSRIDVEIAAAGGSPATSDSEKGS